MDFKFVSHGLYQKSRASFIHKKLCILTNGCANNLKHENEAERPLFPHLLVKIRDSFYICVKEGCSASLTMVREKQT